MSQLNDERAPMLADILASNSITPMKAKPRWNNLSYPEAMQAANEGCKVARQGWNGKGMHVEKQASRYGPCYCLYHPRKDFVHWTSSDADKFATDWYILDKDFH